MKRSLLLTTALFSVTMMDGGYEAHADIVKIRTTTYTYRFPDSDPNVDTSVVTNTSCGTGSSDYCGIGDTRSECRHDTPAQSVSGGWGPNGVMGGYGADADGNGGSTGTVMCTHFYQKGELDEMLFFADIESSKTVINPITVRGYHIWGVPFVRHMRAHPGGKLERAMRFVVIHRNREIAYQMGMSDTSDYIGKILRLLLEPPCFVIGHFVPETNWKSLYNPQDFKAFSEGYRRYKAYKYVREHRAQTALTQIVHKLIPHSMVSMPYMALQVIKI